MLMTLFLPGSAQLVSGNRRVGRIALWTWLSLAVVGVLAVVTSYFWHGLAFWAGTSTVLLQVLRLGLMALAVGWAYLFVDAWRLGQPLTLQRQHRLAIVGVNGFLCFSVAGALLFGAHVVSVQRDFMISMFGNGEAVGAHHGRYNVLLMGGDAGAGRWGLRPDSMTVASIDAETGKTVLISLPRNMQNFPFPEGSVMEKQFPDGFDERGDVPQRARHLGARPRRLFKGSKNPGVDATIEGVEGITGLKMNYWAMVNLEGFKDLVDAVGGVELNVRQRIPVGGLASDVDPLHRARHAHAQRHGHAVVRPRPSRLRRLLPHGPAEVRDERDAPAGQPAGRRCATSRRSPGPSSAMVSTNIPRGEVDRFVDLALKAKSQKIATLSLVPPMINTADPDIDLVQPRSPRPSRRRRVVRPRSPSRPPRPRRRHRVARPPTPGDEATADAADGATDQGAAATPPAPTTPSTPPAVTGGSLGSLSTGYAANQSEDLGAVC